MSDLAEMPFVLTDSDQRRILRAFSICCYLLKDIYDTKAAQDLSDQMYKALDTVEYENVLQRYADRWMSALGVINDISDELMLHIYSHTILNNQSQWDVRQIQTVIQINIPVAAQLLQHFVNGLE